MSEHLSLDKLGFESRAIHAGYEPDPTTGAVIPPIYATSTYKQDGVGGLRGGYEYSRSANPTRTALEECIAALEDGDARLRLRQRARRRGHPAALALRARRPRGHPRRRLRRHLPALRQGRAALGPRLLAGPGRRRRGRRGRDPARGDQGRLGRDARPTRCSTSPTSPPLADVAHQAGALLVVDNTFASPYLQQPLTLGADVVVHSTTKYCGGHSDVVGGALVVRDGDLAERIRLPPERDRRRRRARSTRWLVLRGLRTLALRMERHCDNAEAVVAHLVEPPGGLARSSTPGCAAHPGHEVASRQMKRYGGIVSFRVAAGEQKALDGVRRHRGLDAGGVARRRRVADRAPRADDPRLGGRAPTSRCRRT